MSLDPALARDLADLWEAMGTLDRQCLSGVDEARAESYRLALWRVEVWVKASADLLAPASSHSEGTPVPVT